MIALFEDPRTFAVSPQTHFRAWKPAIVPTAPFRTLQPGEVSQVLAPLSHTILVDRAKLLALGIPDAGLAWSAWMLLFWKAAAAGLALLQHRRRRSPEGTARPSRAGGGVLSEGPHRFFVPPAGAARTRTGARRGGVCCGRSQAWRRDKPRVLLVSPFLPYPLSHGGAVRIWNLCRALAPRVDFILAAIREKHDTVDYAKLHEVFRDVRDRRYRPARLDR